MNKTKTYAREVSCVLILWMVYLSYDPANIETLKVLIYPFMGFALFAFGFKQPVISNFMQQSRAPQPPTGFRHERSREHASGEVQLTDNRSDK